MNCITSFAGKGAAGVHDVQVLERSKRAEYDISVAEWILVRCSTDKRRDEGYQWQ